jgi:DNA polymerase-3 subunit delta'
MPSALIGHQKRWAALGRAFAKGSVPQTLLISGAAHIGKSTLARRFAQLLLCPDTQAVDGLPEPCGHCRTCHQVEIETFPDFRIYRPIVSAAKEEKDWVIAPEAMEGSIITVEVARRFGDEAMRKPLVGPRKVMQIQGCDRMNIEAQNALLKTFEEPVRGLSIVLLCENPNELLPTVRSRCWHLPLGLAGDAEIAHWLQHEYSQAPPQQVEEAVRVAAGRPGAGWRELERLARAEEGDEAVPRFAQARDMVMRLVRSQPVGALALTEEAQRLAKQWWEQDQAGRKYRLKKGRCQSDAFGLGTLFRRACHCVSCLLDRGDWGCTQRFGQWREVGTRA